MRIRTVVLLSVGALAGALLRPAPAPEMVTYQMVFLVKGPVWSAEPGPDSKRIQAEHLAHLGKMHKEGKLVLAGPLTDNGRIRGLAVYKVGTTEEARRLAEADPAVVAGRLAIEAHPWMVEKGILP